jgi:hypothetical protein
LRMTICDWSLEPATIVNRQSTVDNPCSLPSSIANQE